jgi:hypothetical protein
MRDFFKLKALVARVEDGKAYLVGVDPNLLKVGMIFRVSGGLGKEGYVKVVGEESGFVVDEILYGEVSEGFEAKELNLFGGGGALTFSMYNVDVRLDGYEIVPFAIGAVAWMEGFYTDFSYVLGSAAGYTPFDLSAGMRFELFRAGRVFLGVHIGASIFGIYDMDREDIIGMLFGGFAGIDGRYEFSPMSGVFFKMDYKYLLGASGSVITLGYFLGI